jgi:hypothetical protein
MNLHALILYLAATSIAADGYTTQHDWSQPHPHEVNPVAAIFVSHGTAARSAYFVASGAGLYFADRRLSPKHKRIAILGELVLMGAEGYWAGYNVRRGKGW